ncbi:MULTISPECIES: restriction endonuclease subunit S [unclassified Campylobacter]|uniref:restriction endonuclease subunit S n=1 Tax=unclassified Campylobacter TaxID=2593542 RepID=UPI0022E9DB88|nr:MULTISPECIES: restriction endonuclease subunit S [unclassified Campylobacter]MDA3042993.1 restriction endonuclease subunit S [Campylobacter sp. JMF_09 ED2]MDA3044172.1 restriction endonuclease subunit S [Campylobacter sp. JMF_07 ED4]MDA3063522.1 restriction endonuclease subunit S [Campylobacter sp. JMF_11 EL3]MDA3071147.1 restriction endonuclease subunit S [Campylobacter sp. VBCF_03 NA9]MDA3074607.1 restriction endonuclease subunit S [Campylobacter sp. JMF_05 ED3]
MTNPANLKKSILDYAIRGELSAKFRTEFTNLSAYDEIAEFNAKISTLKSQREKLLSNLEKLLKTKPKNSDKIKHIIAKLKTKIKSYRTITPLNTDGDFNPPFEIPNSWAWVKLGDYVKKVTDFVASGSFATLRENVKYYQSPNYAVLVRTTDFKTNFQKDLIYTDKHGYEFLSNSNLFGGELIFPNIGASIGKVFIVPKLQEKMTLAPNSVMVRFFDENSKYWFYYLFSSSFGISALQGISSSTAQGKFNKTDFKNLIVPLPPLAEQQFIAGQLEQALKECESYEAKALNLANLQTKFKIQIPKSILDYAIRGELSAKFRLSCHCEERTGGAISSLSSLRESEANEAIQKNSKISKFKDKGNSLDCFDFSAKNLAMTNKTAFDEIAEFNAKISTLKSQREKLLSNLEKLLKTKPKNSDKIKHIIAKLKTKIKSYRTITPLNTDGDFNPPFEIPNSWAWVKLGEIATINGGYAFKSTNYTTNGVRVIRISDFNENGFIDTNIVRLPYLPEYEPFILGEKNILLCMTGGTVGKSFFVKKLEEKMIVNQRVATIKVRNALPEYINYNVIAPIIQKIIQESKNSTNDNISMETINLFPIPLPPKAEQKFIADELEKLLNLCKNL